jgi:hypothetical protein
MTLIYERVRVCRLPTCKKSDAFYTHVAETTILKGAKYCFHFLFALNYLHNYFILYFI